MSAHYLVVKVETGQGDLSPSKGYKHLATDIYDFLEDDFEECGMGWEVKAVREVRSLHFKEADTSYPAFGDADKPSWDDVIGSK